LRSSYRGGSSYGGYRHSRSLTGIVAEGVIKNTTNLLCHPQNERCSFDNDCCSKNCQIKDAPWSRYTIRRCS
jgi:hypothetical protein